MPFVIHLLAAILLLLLATAFVSTGRSSWMKSDVVDRAIGYGITTALALAGIASLTVL